jgi:hypothetical protein
MFFTRYTDELISKLNVKHENSWQEYESEIFNYWMEDGLQISFNDACEAKDSGLFTPDEFLAIVRTYRQCGGRGNAWEWALKTVRQEEEELEDFSDCMSWEEKRSGYRSSDFI